MRLGNSANALNLKTGFRMAAKRRKRRKNKGIVILNVFGRWQAQAEAKAES